MEIVSLIILQTHTSTIKHAQTSAILPKLINVLSRESLWNMLTWALTTFCMMYMLDIFFQKPLPHITNLLQQSTEHSARYKEYKVYSNKLLCDKLDMPILAIRTNNRDNIPSPHSDWCMLTVIPDRLPKHGTEVTVAESFNRSSLPGKDCFEFKVKICNNSSTQQECNTTLLLLSAVVQNDGYHDLIAYKDGALKIQTKLHNLTTCNLHDTTTQSNQYDWIGIRDTYWTMLFKSNEVWKYNTQPGVPKGKVCSTKAYTSTQSTPIRFTHEGYSSSMIGWKLQPSCTLEPGESQEFTYSILFEPKTQAALSANEDTFPGISRTIDFGYFALLIKPIFDLVVTISAWLGCGIGYALLILMACVRLALFMRYGWIDIQQIKPDPKNIHKAASVMRRWFANTALQCIVSMILYRIAYITPETFLTPTLWISNINIPDTHYLSGYFVTWPSILSLTTLCCVITGILNHITEKMLARSTALDNQALFIACIMLIMDIAPAILGLLYCVNSVVSAACNCYLLVRRRRDYTPS